MPALKENAFIVFVRDSESGSAVPTVEIWLRDDDWPNRLQPKRSEPDAREVVQRCVCAVDLRGLAGDSRGARDCGR